MQILEFEGVQTTHELIALTPGEEIRITIKLYPEDPENVPDGLDVFLLTPGESDGTGFDGYSVLYQFPGIGSTDSYVRLTLIFTPQEGQVLGIRLNSGYTDETSFWRYTVQMGGFDSAPLIFTPTTPDALRFDDPEDPDYGISYERVHILHEDSPYGISVANTLLIHEGLRTLALPEGTIEYYDSITDTLKPLLTLLYDGGGWGPELSYDNVYLPGHFQTPQALHLFGQEVIENDFKLDARGPVFGFIAEAPDLLGSFYFGSSAANPDDAVLTINDEVIGEARWEVGAQTDISFFYGAFLADILSGELTVDGDTSEWSLTGRLLIRSMIDDADPFEVATSAASRGIYNNPDQGGFDGELFAGDGTVVHMRPVLGGAEFNLGLSDMSLKLENGAPFSARIGALKIPLDLSGRFFIKPDFLVTTSATYAETGEIKLDGFSVHADTIDVDPVDFATPLAGARLEDFSAGVAGLWSGDDTPATFAAYFKFGWRGGLSDQPLAEARLTSQLTTAGLEGAVLFGLGEANSLFQGSGHAVLSPYGSSFVAKVGGTFHLAYLGDIVVSQLDLTQRFGAGGKLTGKAEAGVILPFELMSLFALTGPVDSDLELHVGTTEHRSSVDLSMHIASGGYDGELGIRVRFNGTYEFLGGIVLDSGAVNDGAVMGADGDSHDFGLAEATELLLMRAQGDLDPGAIVVIAPDGTEYSGDGLAERGIVLTQDTVGITARVSQAEAGTWRMVAPGATDWIGFADTPDAAVTVSRVMTAEGEALRVVVTGPDQDYDLRVLAEGQAGSTATLFELSAMRPGVHDFAVARLGLAPGDWTLGASLSGEGQVTVEDSLEAPVTITGAADLKITVDLAPNLTEEGDPGLVLIRVENMGDATAYDVEVGGGGGGGGAIAASLAALLPGQSVVITAELATLGFDPGAAFEVTVSATHSSYEAAAADDTATATYAPGDAAGARLWVVDEDSAYGSALGGAVVVVTGPVHGVLALGDDGWVYTPAADYAGADLAVITIDGVETRLWLDVRAINDAPVAADKTLSTGRDHAAALSLAQLLAGAIDADHDNLVVTGVGAAGHGTVTVGADGEAVYTPYHGYTGNDSFGYTVADGQGGEAIVTVAVTVTGETPRTIYAARFDSARVFDVSGDGALHSVTGTAFGDTLIGGSGNETLNGGDGADVMTGAFGNDSYYIDDAGDQVIEQAGQGTDSVRSTLNSYALGDHIEKLLYAGSGDFSGTGNDLANFLTGGAGNDSLTGLEGNDTLNGGAGADLMSGGEGNDSYYVDAPGDQVVENAGQGIDTVRTTLASYGLTDHVEKLLVSGGGDFAGTGNDLANTITGGAGDDTLAGLDGNDRLYGGEGDDVLAGGAGGDHLTGGAGHDTFRFDHAGPSGQRDSVRDFAAAEDCIEISRLAFDAFAGHAAGALSADAFVVGTRAVTADQHIVYNPANGILYYDPDGAGGAAQTQVAVFASLPGLTAGDIFLV